MTYICVLYPRNVASHNYCDTGTTPGGRAVIFDLNTDEWISVMCTIIKNRQTKVMAIKIENQIRTGSASSAYLLKRICCLYYKSVTLSISNIWDFPFLEIYKLCLGRGVPTSKECWWTILMRILKCREFQVIWTLNIFNATCKCIYKRVKC